MHALLSAARAELGWDGVSGSCAFPPMRGDKGGAALPRACRIVQRGSAAATVSDISSNELFEAPVVTADLFEVAASLRRRLGPASIL